MKEVKFLFVIAIILFAFVVNGFGAVVDPDAFPREEFELILVGSVPVADAVFQAGGNDKPELWIDDLNGGLVESNLTWDTTPGVTAEYELHLVYNQGGSGNLVLSITPSGSAPVEISVRVDDWFNAILVSLENHDPLTTSDSVQLAGNDVTGLSFSDISAPPPPGGTNTWEGVLITFPDNNPTNVEPFEINSTLRVGSLAGFSPDSFCGEFRLVQTSVVHVEPKLPNIVYADSDGVSAVVDMRNFGGLMTCAEVEMADLGSNNWSLVSGSMFWNTNTPLAVVTSTWSFGELGVSPEGRMFRISAGRGVP